MTYPADAIEVETLIVFPASEDDAAGRGEGWLDDALDAIDGIDHTHLVVRRVVEGTIRQEFRYTRPDRLKRPRPKRTKKKGA